MKTVKQTTVKQDFINEIKTLSYGAILADPPWRFTNRTGKVAPEHKRLSRYGTLSFQEIQEIPVYKIAAEQSHLYLWAPNALIPQGLEIMKALQPKKRDNLSF